MLDSSQKLVLAFVTLILGAVLIGTVASNSLAVTQKTNVYDETHNLASCVSITAGGGWKINVSDSDCNRTVTNNPTGWKTYDCPLVNVIFKNGTKTALTLNTDYRLYDSTGVVQVLNTTATENLTGNNTYTDYTYCRNDYVNLGFGRTTLNMIAGFFALALLAFSVGVFYSVAKDYDIV